LDEARLADLPARSISSKVRGEGLGLIWPPAHW
jgi:hypothetical protein